MVESTSLEFQRCWVSVVEDPDQPCSRSRPGDRSVRGVSLLCCAGALTVHVPELRQMAGSGEQTVWIHRSRICGSCSPSAQGAGRLLGGVCPAVSTGKGP